MRPPAYELFPFVEPPRPEFVAPREKCMHTSNEVRVLICGDGTPQYRIQCRECGFSPAFCVQKRAVSGIVVPPFDHELRHARHWNRKAEDENYRRASEWREGRSAAWWDYYVGYMQSKNWTMRKAHLFESRGKKCEWCGAAPSLRGVVEINVHHLCYDLLGDEPDEALVVLCQPCHEAEHAAGCPASAQYRESGKAALALI